MGAAIYQGGLSTLVYTTSQTSLNSVDRVGISVNFLSVCVGSCEDYCAFHKHANSEVQKPTVDCVFATVNHLNGPLRKQNFTLTGAIGHGF